MVNQKSEQKTPVLGLKQVIVIIIIIIIIIYYLLFVIYYLLFIIYYCRSCKRFMMMIVLGIYCWTLFAASKSIYSAIMQLPQGTHHPFNVFRIHERLRTGRRAIGHCTPQTLLPCFAMIGNRNPGHNVGLLGLKEGVVWKRCVEPFLDYIGIDFTTMTIIFFMSWETR